MSKSSLQLKKAYNIHSKEDQINEHFAHFFQNLCDQKPLEWGILDKLLRKTAIPWLYRKLTQTTSYNHSIKQQLAQEIYANSLQTYVRLLPNGSFESVSNLMSLMYSIADKKLKETYRQIQKNGKVVYTDNSEWMNSFEDPKWKDDAFKAQQKELVVKLREKMSDLSDRDRDILMRYASGEKLKDIADSMNVPQATCRKQKERALQRLRKLFFDTVKLLLLLTWTAN